MQRNQHLLRVRGACDLVLDTTYCDPRYTFPTQQSVMEYCLHAVRAELFNGPRTLVVFGTYTIGKERLFLHVAEALQKKVCILSTIRKCIHCGALGGVVCHPMMVKGCVCICVGTPGSE